MSVIPLRSDSLSIEENKMLTEREIAYIISKINNNYKIRSQKGIENLLNHLLTIVIQFNESQVKFSPVAMLQNRLFHRKT